MPRGGKEVTKPRSLGKNNKCSAFKHKGLTPSYIQWYANAIRVLSQLTEVYLTMSYRDPAANRKRVGDAAKKGFNAAEKAVHKGVKSAGDKGYAALKKLMSGGFKGKLSEKVKGITPGRMKVK